MVFDRKNRKRESIDSVAKSFIATSGLILFVLLFPACSSRPSQPSNVAPSLQDAQSGSGLRLTSIGHNRGGRFSPDGKRILFVSGQRDHHKQAQLYEISLESFRERRVTFHDGQCLEGDYSPDGQSIVYASTTDEIKERPTLLNPVTSSLPQTELYLSDLKGTRIERLTHLPGYQGNFSWINSQRLLFISEAQERTVISTLSLHDPRPQLWQSDPQAQLRLPTVDGTANRVIWVKQSGLNSLLIGLKIAGKISLKEVPFLEIQSMQWIESPEKTPLVLMSAKRAEDRHLKAWILDPIRNCSALLFEEPGDLKDLRAGAKQEKLLYSFESGGKSQLFLREFPPFPASCDGARGEHAEKPWSKKPKAAAPGTSAPAGSAAGPKEDPKRPPGSAG